MNETKTPILIIKSDGTQESFNEQKLIHSLRRAGASDEVIDDALDNIRGELRTGITTHEIYSKAYAILRKHEHKTASRYSLRRAVMALGPTGHPFEDFVGEIFRTQGYKVSTRDVLPGKCTTHELDLIAKKDGKILGAELKFHNDVSTRSDLKVVLYVRARFDDLNARQQLDPNGPTPLFDEVLLITNTKFTSQAIEYSMCAGIRLIGWNYPVEGNLQDLIEKNNVHPLTCLTTLSSNQKRSLLEKNIVLCKSLYEHMASLSEIGLSSQAIQTTLDEVNQIIH